jgi:hypothetical protein
MAGTVRPSPVVGKRLAHMSYRIGDRIYWTKRKLPLNAGEMTLTTGDIEIRSRCGNQISETARLPTSPDEPDSVEFDRLVASEPNLLATNRFPSWIVSPSVGLPGGGVPGTSDVNSDTLLGGGNGNQQPFSTGLFGGFIGGLPTASSPSALPPGQTVTVDPVAPVVVNPPPLAATGGQPDGRPPVPELPNTTAEIPWPPDAYSPPSDYFPPSVEDLPVAVIPEPGTLVLLGTALTGLAAMVLRKRHRARQNVQDPPV